MGLPLEYRKSGEGAIASYAYTDIAEGTGIVTFYGLHTKETTTDSYILTQNSGAYSNDQNSTVSTTTGSAIKILDLDFDTTFNLPKRIKGTAFVTGTIGCNVRNAGTTTIYFIAKIRKVSDGTETEIANSQSESLAVTGSPSVSTLSVKIPITTQANFKKDDILRLTMEIWSGQDGGASTSIFYHDPLGRDDATLDADDTSKLIFYVPFVLDL